MTQGQTPYPVQFSVDYPEKPLDRLSTFFRLIAFIPIAIVIALVSGQWQDQDTAFLVAVGGALRLLRATAAHPVSPEVPAMVVRLERGAR